MKRTIPVLLLILGGLIGGCTAVRQLAQFREVSFQFRGIGAVSLDGVTYEQLARGSVGPLELLQLGRAMQEGVLPLEFSVLLDAYNPPDNGITARVAEMSWKVYLEGTPLAEGVLTEAIAVPPGDTVTVGIPVALNVLDLVQRNLQDALDLALALAGAGGQPRTVRVEVVPVVETPLGRVRYPRALTFERTVGG